ncbi:MAG: TIGR00282 family metallophosphoesterase [Candidatus Omnitrophota bacterium]
MKILFIGDIVGKPGREVVAKLLPKIKEEHQINLVIANAENAAGGSGLTAKVVSELFNLGINAITSGDHIWKRSEIVDIIDVTPYLLRPANLAPNVPGKGHCLIQKDDLKIGLINLQGRVFMQAVECPFRTAKLIVADLKKVTPIIIVDMHAEATSEKIALGYFLDGEVSAVLGTHTHVPTADEHILSGGTAYITDVGMAGPCDSVIGRRKEEIIERFLTGMPTRFEVATGDLRLQGVVIDIDNKTGRAISIQRIQEKLSP